MKRSQSLNKSLNNVKYEQYVNNLNARLPDLRDPNDIDCKRWPWELVQNAKDTVVKRTNKDDRYVDVKFKYYIDSEGKKKLYFEHNGDQFSDKAITGLIWKFSAEKRNEQLTEDGLSRDKQSTGRFGTGFMTTHALSFTVDVSGSLYHGDPGIERNVSVDFTLHREGPSDKDYIDGVDRTEREIDENMDKHPIPNGTELPTRFTYHLNREASEKAAEMGIRNVRSNAAQTMLFCPTVRSITIEDDINNLYFKITRENNDERKGIVKETVFVEESSDMPKPMRRRFISIEIEEYSEAISSHWIAKDRNLRLHIAVEVDNNNNILPIPPTSPAVYCSLPLIGFEQMTLPFYINSNDFEPIEARTSLFLKKKRFEIRTNEETDTTENYYLKNGVNWSILERSISLYEEIVNFLIINNYNHRYNLVNGLSEIFKSSWTEETKYCLASRFILPLRSMLVTKELVKTKSNYRRINSGIKFVECTKERDQKSFYNICESVYGDNLAIEEENQKWIALKWGRFSFIPEFDEKKADCENPFFPTIDCSDIAKYIEDSITMDRLVLMDNNTEKPYSIEIPEDNLTKNNAIKLAWLNKFYQWIAASNLPILSQRKIVPNRLGVFCNCEQGGILKDAKAIPTSIFDFMKRIQIDWDANLLMEGIQYVPLTKETIDNVISAIKERTRYIREHERNNLIMLLPLLLALPIDNDARVTDFYNKRKHIVSILKTMYSEEVKDVEEVTLDLKAETWEDTDKWFMGIVAKVIADRKHLDIPEENDKEDNCKNNYCTAEWLAQTLDFMFQNNYLHQEDIMYKKDNNDTFAIIPNRYGEFLPVNKLYTQGQIPNELLADKLSITGYDIKKELLYVGFTLNEKVSISEQTISKLAATYNTYFVSAENENDKLSVANYLIHLIPACGDHCSEIRELYNIFTKVTEEEKKTTIISTSDLDIWTGAKDFLVKYLCSESSKLSNIENIGRFITIVEEDCFNKNSNYLSLGLDWLNRLSVIVENGKIDLDDDIKLVPDWYGTLHRKSEMKYDGSILLEYQYVSELIGIIDGKLWDYYAEKKDEDDGLLIKTVYPRSNYVTLYNNNTDEKIFSLVDRIIYYCTLHYSSDWRGVLKDSIKILLRFFDANEKEQRINSYCNKADDNLERLFAKTYQKRKELAFDFIYDDPETKARFYQINDNYTASEIEILIENKEFVKKLLNNNTYLSIQKILDEFPNTDFASILDILRKEQGDFNTDVIPPDISQKRKIEIGDKGECFVYEELCKKFNEAQIRWSNYAPFDETARIVTFNNHVYRLKTTPHDYDFVVTSNNKTYYIEVKTTTSSIRDSLNFVLTFERKEWEWIDNNSTENALHYIVRVFEVEKNPKAYYLRQELNVE